MISDTCIYVPFKKKCEESELKNSNFYICVSFIVENKLPNFSAGIKKYVVGLIIKTSSDPTCVEVSEFSSGEEEGRDYYA